MLASADSCLDLAARDNPIRFFPDFEEQQGDFLDGKFVRNRGALPPVAIPDRTRRPEVQAFAPDGLGLSRVIDPDGKVIAKRKAEAFRADVAITRHVAGNSRFRRPRSTTVGGTAVKHIPEWSVARIHPRNSHIAGIAGGKRGKSMLYSRRRSRHIQLRRPRIASSSRRSEINPLRTFIHRSRIPQRI